VRRERKARPLLLAAVLIAATALLSPGGRAAPPAPAAGAARPASAPASQPGLIRLKGLTLDRAGRQLIIQAEVCYDGMPLEAFLCRAGTKDYESVLSTPARPSDVHAALLALGLTQGKPARMSKADTQPARFLPPEGPRLAVTLRWKDKDGKDREAPAGAWLTHVGDKKADPPKEWVFVGSDVLPGGRYWADQEMEGDIISLSNFASAVLDVPFQSTSENASLEFTGNAKAIPPKGTAVDVVIRLLEGAEKSPAARFLVELDRFGRYWIDGQARDADDLAAWAGRLLQKHSEAMVVIRADPLARLRDLDRARDQLRLAGVPEVDEQTLAAPEDAVPLVAEQAAWALAKWKEKFAKWDKLLWDPFQEARDHLQDVQRELRLLEARKAMLGEYEAHLRAALKEAQAATQPASRQ
jgi:hypothetical protein